MSNLIPPLLSSSPPPIVGPLDEDDDDEFGDFRAAANSFDCDELSLPPSPDKELKRDCPRVNLDINCNKSQKVTNATEMPIQNQIVNEEVDKDFQDKRKSIEESESAVNCSNSRPVTPPIVADFNHTDSFPSVFQQPEEKNPEDGVFIQQNDQLDLLEPDLQNMVSDSHGSKHDNEVIEDEVTEENLFEAFSDKTNSEEISELNEINDIKLQEDGIDEINIDISERDLDKEEISENFESDPKLSDDEFGDFEKHFSNCDKPPEPEEDDFDDFVDPLPPDTVQEPTEDDFGDFETSECDIWSQTEKPKFLEIDEKNAAVKSGTILKEIFPEIVVEMDAFELYDETKGNMIFEELKDVTETNALIYQWSKSNSQKMFFKALNIDTRNILYGPAWNCSMPRFAANLGLTPLEPVRTEILNPTPFQNSSSSPSMSSQKNISDIPTAQFDWSGSGLINPLDSTSVTAPGDVSQPKVQNDLLPPPPTTTEKQEAVPSLFDVTPSPATIAESNTQSDDFSQFESPKLIPLRETHIFNELSDAKPGWLQPTILTPDLPRKETVIDPQEEDEFDDFQMVLPEESKEKEKVIMPEVKSLALTDLSEFETSKGEIKTSKVHNTEHIVSGPVGSSASKKEEDEEFTEFHSSVTPAEILKPVPLEPLKPSVQYSPVTQINWPDPGVTDEDIRNIELAFSLKNEEQLSKKPSVDDDEWTDFVSVTNPHKLQLPERTSTPDLPLSVLNLNKVEAPKQPIPVITPSGLVQTKLSSNLTKSVVQTSVQQNLFRPPSTMFQPSIISHQYATNFFPNAAPSTKDDDDDDWSDFVSSQPQPVNGYQPKNPAKVPQVNWTNATTNIIMNPTHFEAFQSFAPPQNKKVSSLPARNTIPSISAIPDLEFIAPKNRTSKK